MVERKFAIGSALEDEQTNGARARAFLSVLQVSNAFMEERDLHSLLNLIVETAVKETKADRGSLMLLDPQSQELFIHAAIGLPKGVAETTRVSVGQGISGWVAKMQEPLILIDRVHPIPEIQEAMRLEQIESGLCVPMVTQGELLGALSVSRLKKAIHFTQSDLELLSILGENAAIAIQRARLYENLTHQQSVLERLRAETIQAEENERRIVALEIHDVISQALASLFYRIQTCEKLLNLDIERAQKEFFEIKLMAQGILDDVSRLMFSLRPPVLDDLGVFAALRRYLDQYQWESQIMTRMTIKGRRRRFHPAVEITIYRIVQEALTNVRKHAKASRVWVRFEVNQGKIEGVVEDNGKGFNPGDFLAKKEAEGHLGLLSMKERAALLGGTLQVESSPGKGTAVKFEFAACPPPTYRGKR